MSAGAQAASSFGNIGPLLLREQALQTQREALEAQLRQQEIENAFREEQWGAGAKSRELDEAFASFMLKFPFLRGGGDPSGSTSSTVGQVSADLSAEVKNQEKERAEEEKFREEQMTLEIRRAARRASREEARANQDPRRVARRAEKDARRAAHLDALAEFRGGIDPGFGFAGDVSNIDFSGLPQSEISFGDKARLRFGMDPLAVQRLQNIEEQRRNRESGDLLELRARMAREAPPPGIEEFLARRDAALGQLPIPIR
jgi:hypothetical protein